MDRMGHVFLFFQVGPACHLCRVGSREVFVAGPPMPQSSSGFGVALGKTFKQWRWAHDQDTPHCCGSRLRGYFAGLAMAQGKQGETLGSEVSSSVHAPARDAAGRA